MKKISILGSTGSIGKQSIEVVKATSCAEVIGLAAGRNIELLYEQITQLRPKVVSVLDGKDAETLSERLRQNGLETEVLWGVDGNIEIAKLAQTDIVLNAMLGFSGLLPTIAAIKARKDIAIANKETLVAAGEIVTSLAEANGVKLLPVDSEHSAIFQCLQGNKSFEKIYLTASGGPFRGKTFAELEKVTADDALKHPNWNMGRKITIDSATLMNKGLEYIEAKWLFNVSERSQIEILVHPQSVIHSMVQFCDGAVLAQLGEPDMRVPIQYALTYPERVQNDFERVDFAQIKTLTFEKPDYVNFPCLELAIGAIEEGGACPAAMNAANEAAVERFLNNEIGFNDIPRLIDSAMSAYNIKFKTNRADCAEDIFAADEFARGFVKSSLK